MSMESYLEERSKLRASALRNAGKYSSDRQWKEQSLSPEQRLLKFDVWMRRKLEARIDWTWAGADKPKRVEQCRIEFENLVLGFWQRGWLLDGAKLAAHIELVLADISAAQKADRVQHFWPFFKSVLAKYVGLNSEEIREEAMSAGVAVSDVFSLLEKKATSLPELMAQRRDETLRDRQTKQRRADARKAADKAQAQLF